MTELETYYIIETGGSRYLVSPEMASAADNAITERHATLLYRDIFGGSGIIVVRTIESVYISTPEIRRLAHRHHAAWHIEEQEVKREYYTEHGLLYGDQP